MRKLSLLFSLFLLVCSVCDPVSGAEPPRVELSRWLDQFTAAKGSDERAVDIPVRQVLGLPAAGVPRERDLPGVPGAERPLERLLPGGPGAARCGRRQDGGGPGVDRPGAPARGRAGALRPGAPPGAAGGGGPALPGRAPGDQPDGRRPAERAAAPDDRAARHGQGLRGHPRPPARRPGGGRPAHRPAGEGAGRGRHAAADHPARPAGAGPEPAGGGPDEEPDAAGLRRLPGRRPGPRPGAAHPRGRAGLPGEGRCPPSASSTASSPRPTCRARASRSR